MPSEARQKTIMEKLNRAQKCSILGPQNLGSGGARAPGAPPGSAPELTLHYVTNAAWKLCSKIMILLYLHQYNLLHKISNNIEFYEESVPRTKEIHHSRFSPWAILPDLAEINNNF